MHSILQGLPLTEHPLMGASLTVTALQTQAMQGASWGQHRSVSPTQMFEQGLMRIREAQARDAHGIGQLHALSWQTAYRGMLADAYLDGRIAADRQALWAERFAKPAANQHVLVAETDDALVGFACAFGAHEPQWGTLLENLHVAPALKRSGIGSHLVREVLLWSQRRYPKVDTHLWVLKPNLAAQAFYQRMGASEAGQGMWSAPDGSDIPQLRYAWAAASPDHQRGSPCV